MYFHGRVVFDASFSSGDLTVVLRRLEPINGGPTPAMVTSGRSVSRAFRATSAKVLTTVFTTPSEKNPGSAAFFDRLRTIIVKDNQLVITALDDPGAVASKADQR